MQIKRSVKVAMMAVVAAAAMSFAVPAHATVLAPGGVSAAVASDNGGATGTLLASQTVAWVTPGAETGSLRSAVYRNASNFLDFYYQVVVSTGADPITREANFNFVGFTTDVFVRSDSFGIFAAGTIAPSGTNVITRSASGQTVGFNFDGSNNLVAGTTSYILVVKTNAEFFTIGNSTVQDGGSANVQTYSPTAIPEPASIVLLGTGLMGAAGAARRRLRRNKN